jgi:hypothetical protein
MTAKTRKLAKQFTTTYSTEFKNLLVSGCSYTFNNSENHICSWPYYLRDLAGFNEVYDCSQSGAGSNHIFNSIINEIETNININIQDTLVIIMWSGLTRTDVIAEQDITAELMWVPVEEGRKVLLAWQIYVIPTKSSDYWLVRINAENGKTNVRSSHIRTASGSHH